MRNSFEENMELMVNMIGISNSLLFDNFENVSRLFFNSM